MSYFHHDAFEASTVRRGTATAAACWDTAIAEARKHVDVRFFWRLFQALPAAEAAIGEQDEAQADVMSLSARLNDLTHSGEGELADALRPLYIEYLTGRG